MLGILIKEIHYKHVKYIYQNGCFFQVKYIIDGVKLMDKAMIYLCYQITYTTCSFDWDIISGCFYEDSDAIFVLINIKDSPSSTCGAIESTTHFYYIVIKIVRLDTN